MISPSHSERQMERIGVFFGLEGRREHGTDVPGGRRQRRPSQPEDGTLWHTWVLSAICLYCCWRAKAYWFRRKVTFLKCTRSPTLMASALVPLPELGLGKPRWISGGPLKIKMQHHLWGGGLYVDLLLIYPIICTAEPKKKKKYRLWLQSECIHA